jgi:hypothetical protein
MIKKLSVFLAMLLVAAGISQAQQTQESKAEKIRRIRQNNILTKPLSFKDRKIGVMDNGQMAVNYDNNGFIGDRNYTRSIEWPVGSLNYLTWQVGIVFGAVTANGDTICSESYNDISDNQFNPEPGYDNPNFSWDILQTPIVARSDLVDSYAPQWNGLWPSLDGTFIDPEELKAIGRQESYWVMRDNNDPEVSPSTPLNLEVVGRFLEINSSLTKDFVFAFYTVKNIGNQTLSQCRFGVLVDPDMPALVGAEFEDDDDGFIRDLNLAYARDSDNFYASKPGLNIGHFGTKFLRSPKVNNEELGLTGWTTFEYGDMPAEGEFYLDEEGPIAGGPQFKSRDHAQYAYMQPGLFMKPRLNTDVGFLMSSGEFDLAPNQTVEMIVAFIAAPDFDALLSNANAAQRVFDNNFIGPTAPRPPEVTAVSGNKSATLYWDAEPTESSQDALTGRADFEGYRIYRSEKQGRNNDDGTLSWGKATDSPAYPNGVLPLAEYDVINTPGQLAAIVVQHSNQISQATITSEGLADGSQPGDAEGIDNSTYFSNDNFQIIFDTDTTFTVLNSSRGTLLNYLADLSAAVGFAVLDTTWTLLADNPDATHGVYHSGYHLYVTGMFVRIEEGRIEQDGQIIISPPATGDVFTIDQRQNATGKNSGLSHSWKDPSTLINGYEYWYTVTAYDRADLELGVPVNENGFVTQADALADDQTVSVVPQAPHAGFVDAAIDSGANKQIFSHVAGQADISSFGLQIIDPRKLKSTTYEISFNTAASDKTFSITDIGAANKPQILKDQPFYDAQLDNAALFDGMRLQVADVEFNINLDKSTQTVYAGPDTLTLNADSIEPRAGANDHDFLFKFVQGPNDSANFRYTYADWDTGVPVKAPFFVIDLATGDTMTVEILDTREGEGDADGTYDVAERIAIGDTKYTGSGGWEASTYSYRFGFAGGYAAGAEFKLVTNKPLTAADRYQFGTTAADIDPEQAKNDLDQIRVVPNPFVVTSGFDTVQDRHEIHFTRLPLTCTIKIFTLTGELVRTLQHSSDVNGSSIEKWDLKTEFGSEVAYGVYLYHINSDVGKKMGKIAIMR